MRRKSTQAEKMLWERLRSNTLGVRFFRQYSIEGYVVDFYCPEKRLAIEIEGSIHTFAQQKNYDTYRKRLIEAYNIKFLMFTNLEIYTKSEDVMRRIKEVVNPPVTPS